MDLKSAEILESITPQEVERMVRELDEKQTKDFLKGSVGVMELHARLCSVRGFTPREASRLFPKRACCGEPRQSTKAPSAPHHPRSWDHFRSLHHN